MCLHNLVSSLRRAIRPDVVQTVSAGYVLHVAPVTLDALRFERLIASSFGAGSRQRVCTLATALELWRGSPFVDVRYESFAPGEIGRLEELHALALEQRLEAELELGSAGPIVAELTGLVARFPFRERARAADGRATPIGKDRGCPRLLPRLAPTRSWCPRMERGHRAYNSHQVRP
jgi:DNA-binding SARP family transcriptional activator